MNGLILLLVALALGFSVYSYYQVVIEQRRNRILQGFIAGIIRSISNYQSKTDAVSPEEMPDRYSQLPMPYKGVLENVEYELLKDFDRDVYIQWLREGRSIFDSVKYRGDGFNFIYLDLFDRLVNRHRSRE